MQTEVIDLNRSTLRKLATGSGAARWLACPSSVALSLGITEKPKKYSDEGTRLHSLTKIAIQENIPLDDIVDPQDSRNSRYIRMAVEEVRNTSSGPWFVEERLPFLGSSGGIDCYCIDGKTAYLYDFKFGVGVRVWAHENEQMAFYACAIKEKHPEITRMIASVIQPKIDGTFEDTPSISSWTIPYQSLAAWRRKFEEGLEAVEEAKIMQIGDHCQFCPAKGKCPLYFAFVDAKQEEQETLPILGTSQAPVDINRIARLLTYKKRIVSWFAKAEEYLTGLAVQGQEIPYHTLETKRTNRKWHYMMTEEEIADELRERGVKDPYEKTLMPFTRVEALGVNVDDLLYKPAGEKALKMREFE